MEYATQDQAQTAIQTLSNKELMGRLVYVREVRPVAMYHGPSAHTSRTVNLSLASRVKLPAEAVAASTAVWAEVDSAAVEVSVADTVVVEEVVVTNSTSQTCVTCGFFC